MTPGYKLVVDGPAVNALFGCQPHQRQRLLRFLETLAANPFHTGDCEVRPVNDHPYQVKFLAPFKITYWADDAVKELRVVDVQRLPR